MKGNCTKLLRHNGTATDLIKGRVSVTAPSITRETVEKEILLDCDPSGGSPTQEKSPGTRTIGDISVEVIWNPVNPDDTATPEIENEHNHHLFEEDESNETAAWWIIPFPNSENTGVAVHCFVQELSSVEFTPNNDVKRTFTLMPTGAPGGYVKLNDIDSWTPPATPEAPVDYYDN